MDTLACGPSSEKLRTDVASFLLRAEKIEAHPLAGERATFKVNVRLDLKTGQMTGQLDHNLKDENGINSLATLMRSAIFVEQDPISLNVLTKAIEREHVLLRGHLKEARTKFEAWKKHMYVGAEAIGTPALVLPEGQTAIQQIRIGPPGISPSGVALESLTTDYEYANAYLNACVWHSDSEKAKHYFAASAHMKGHYAKCAEIRTLEAVGIVLPLRDWILDARAAGHDF